MHGPPMALFAPSVSEEEENDEAGGRVVKILFTTTRTILDSQYTAMTLIQP